MMKSSAKDVDAYIAEAPEAAREKLTQLRAIIRSAAPKAEEGISYNMPFYKYHGPLVGFAAYSEHVSLFGAIPEELRGELASYETGKGTVRFPIGKPLPKMLIRRFVEARARANEAKTRSC